MTNWKATKVEGRKGYIRYLSNAVALVVGQEEDGTWESLLSTNLWGTVITERHGSGAATAEEAANIPAFQRRLAAAA